MSEVDPVAQLAQIQGPSRHSWWLFWSRMSGVVYSFGMPAWVVNAVGSIARLERLTR